MASDVMRVAEHTGDEYLRMYGGPEKDGGNEARTVACRAVAACLDALDPDRGGADMQEVFHMLASVLREPGVLL